MEGLCLMEGLNLMEGLDLIENSVGGFTTLRALEGFEGLEDYKI